MSADRRDQDTRALLARAHEAWRMSRFAGVATCAALIAACGGGSADEPAGAPSCVGNVCGVVPFDGAHRRVSIDPSNGRPYPYVECIADAVYCGKTPDETKTAPRTDCAEGACR